MALITQLLGGQARAGPLDFALDIGTGTILGIALNDAWEIGQFPGYYQDTGFIELRSVNGAPVGVGWDDVAQVSIGLAVALFQNLLLSRDSTSLSVVGLGIAAGSAATKAAEIYETRLQLIPHESPPP